MSSLLDRFFGYISGERRGAAAMAVRAALSVLSVPYRLVTGARAALYRNGLLLCHELDARVISVGNITTGGTGKTPLVVWIGRWLKDHGIRTAILSRGYGAKAGSHLHLAPGGRNAVSHINLAHGRHVRNEDVTPSQGESDETLLFQRQLPGVPHVVGRDRYRAGLRAIREHGAECLVLDDGFQHLALGRDLDIVVIDSLLPFGYGRLLPRGLLREPLSGLRRADLVVLTRCDVATRDQVREVQRQVRQRCGACPIAESAHRPVSFRRLGADEGPTVTWIQGRKVYAFSALGNRGAFPKTLEALGARIVHHEAFRDHHWYSADDLAAIARQATDAGAEVVVTTEKDAVKIRSFPEGAPPLYVLAVELALTRGEELLVGALDRVSRG